MTEPDNALLRLDSSTFDAYAPSEIAVRIETAGVKKAGLALVPLIGLSILAGAFIAFGAALYTVAVTDTGMGYGPTRVFGGLVFCLGLILVIVGGAELFTGNALIVMGWADRKVSTSALARNWGISYCGNLVGAVATAGMIAISGVYEGADAQVWQTAIAIAQAKVALGPLEALVRGVLCNTLVCLAVWLCFAAHSVTAKVAAIVFPITAFVALGFEHSIANMFFLPVAMFGGADGVDVGGIVGNLVPVTIGNIIGGGAFVALTYYIIYLRQR